MGKRAAIYVRVSTDKRTVENQVRELRQTAERRGWEIVEQYHDAGVSGAKGRDNRPGLDRMLKDASKRRFDVVMAWAIDRLGRSLIDLLGTIQTLEACGVDLYVDQQSIDTTTPAGRLMFQVTGAFAEFERSMIRQRVHAGLKRAVEAGKTLGRPRISAAVEKAFRRNCAPAKASSRSPARLASAPAPCSALRGRCRTLSKLPRKAEPLRKSNAFGGDRLFLSPQQLRQLGILHSVLYRAQAAHCNDNASACSRTF
jgi:DNA invertase Pin-like site-specific DNA recombinase